MPTNPAGLPDPPAAASPMDLAASPGVGERPSLPEPYWSDPKRGLSIYHADCRSILPCFADGEFGSVVTVDLLAVQGYTIRVPAKVRLRHNPTAISPGNTAILGRDDGVPGLLLWCGMNDDEAFGHWLAGFIDGEGCFRVRRAKRGHYYNCAFSLKLRDDDRPILEEACRRVGAGRVVADSCRSGNSNPCAVWKTESMADCERLVAYLDRFPLRAKKRKEYEAWREAVSCWRSHPRGNRWAGRPDRGRMEAHKQIIEALRAYGQRDAPRQDPECVLPLFAEVGHAS